MNLAMAWRKMLLKHWKCTGLTWTAKALALDLSEQTGEARIDWTTGEWTATDGSMAKAVGTSPSTVRDARRALMKAGWWFRTVRGSKQGGVGVASSFELSMPVACPKCGDLPQPTTSCLLRQVPTDGPTDGPTDSQVSPSFSKQGSVKEPPPTPSEPVPQSGGRAAEEEEEQTASRDAMEVRSGGRPIPDALARQKHFTSGDEAGRFLDDTRPDVDNRVAYLRSVRKLEPWAEEVEGWRADQRQQVLVEANARFAHHAEDGVLLVSTFRNIVGTRWKFDFYRRYSRHGDAEFSTLPEFEAAWTVALGGALDRLGGWEPLEEAVTALEVDRDAGREFLPEPIAWLENLAVAEPAVTDPPLPPEPWDVGTDTDDKFAWRAQCAPLAAGEF